MILSLRIREVSFMSDNIIIEKIWQENDLLELVVKSSTEYVTVCQTCYIQSSDLKAISKQIAECVKGLQQNCYVEFGKKKGNYTPAFSMDILEINASGKVKIEVDMEISDDDTRKHRCCFYIKSELGLLEKFSVGLEKLMEGSIGSHVELN